MGNQSRTFDTKTLARKLAAMPPASPPGNAPDSEKVSVSALSDLVFQRLFLPIAKGEPVPLAGLDFAEITYGDLERLAKVLYGCRVFEIFGIADVFRGIKPAVSPRRMFI
jgi:hypothetical protein